MQSNSMILFRRAPLERMHLFRRSVARQMEDSDDTMTQRSGNGDIRP